MSDFEMLLSAWLNGGEIPADFKPTSNVEEYLLAILNGVDDNVDPKSRADVLLDAIAAKYAGYATGITDLRAKLGLDTVPEFDEATTPQLIALAQDLINGFALGDLAEKGATGVARNTLAILDAYSNLPSGGGGNKSHAVIGNLEIASVPSGYSEYTVQIGEEITAEYVVSLGLAGGPYAAYTVQSMWYYISKKTSTSFTIGVYTASAMTNVTFEWAIITDKAFATCDYGVTNGMIDNCNFAAGTTSINIVFDTPKASTDYFVVANVGKGTTYFAEMRLWVSNKSAAGFTINVNVMHANVSNTAVRWFCIDKSGVDEEPVNVIISSAEMHSMSYNTGYSLAKVTNSEIGVTSNTDVCIFYSFRNGIKNTTSSEPFGVIAALGTDEIDGEYSYLDFWTGGYYGQGSVSDCAFVACQPTT